MNNFYSEDKSSNHDYRTELPNIIFNLKLTPHQFIVYCAIKQTAGDGGQCIKSYETLSKQIGICARLIKKIIPTLCEIHPLLGKALITRTKRRHEYGDSDTNSLTINDIWPENFQRFKKDGGGSAYYAPPSEQNAQRCAPYAPGVVHNMHQGCAPHAPKEEPIKKNPLKKNIPPSVPSSGGLVDDPEFNKKLVSILNLCKKLDFPFSEAGILSAMRETSPFAVQEVLKGFSKRLAENRILKIPDRWLRSEAIKQHEMDLIKKDYKDL